jgi:hypothetical protein
MWCGRFADLRVEDHPVAQAVRSDYRAAIAAEPTAPVTPRFIADFATFTAAYAARM